MNPQPHYLGVGTDMIIISLIGGVLHILMKWAYAINEAHKAKTPFYFLNWMSENAVYFVITIIVSPASLFFIDSYWPPITAAKALICGLVAGSAIFNIFPIVTNPELWRKIGSALAGKWSKKADE